MLGAVTLVILPILISASNEGNLHLLEDEISVALQSCSTPKDINRQKRANLYDTHSRIDNNIDHVSNQNGHERRNTSDLVEHVKKPNYTNHQFQDRHQSNETIGSNLTTVSVEPNVNRVKRNDPLLSKPHLDQCLSQCIFANLQVVDVHGIPRESELWELIQGAVSSQQSRAALQDQLRACFQELQSEVEDDGCSYSNKLERCLMLRFEDRKPTQKPNTDDKS